MFVSQSHNNKSIVLHPVRFWLCIVIKEYTLVHLHYMRRLYTISTLCSIHLIKFELDLQVTVIVTVKSELKPALLKGQTIQHHTQHW